MLGKNEIDHVSELETLTKLDVLDLHSNRLTSVMGLSGLPALRILNLSGNRIEDVWQLGALRRLTELNLRRNELERLSGLDSLKSLRRLFLSNNRLASFEDCQCVLKMVSLVELAMDGNPLAAQNTTTGSPYRQMILTALPALKHLDLKRITEQERKTCNANAALRRADEKVR
jgi:leucine-rich repeat-containing protein 49